jgi:hypothetical protein
LGIEEMTGWMDGLLIKVLSMELESTGRPGITVARDSLSNSVNTKRNMKTFLFIIGLSAGLMGPALAQTNEPGSPAAVTNEIPSDALATKSGAVYHKFRIEKLGPAGLTISYALNGGGMGLETIPLNLLPDDWQQRYGYDSDKAAIPPGSPAAATNEIPRDALTTKSGTVYHKFHIEKVDPAGLTISYVLDNGGVGVGKIPFNLLSDEWQSRYGYNPDKAAKFDAEQKQAMAQMREQMVADEKAYREKRAQAEAAEEAAKQAAAAETTQTTNQVTNPATNSPAMTGTNQPALQPPPVPPSVLPPAPPSAPQPPMGPPLPPTGS